MFLRLTAILLVSVSTSVMPGAQTAASACVSAIKNQSWPSVGPKCLEASASPALGLLYPISQEWFVSPTGQIGFGTTTPTYDVEVANPQSNSLTLGIKASCSNATVLELNNTEPAAHDYALASWGSLAGGPGTLQGKFSILDNTAGVHRIIIDTNGNVGIGPSVYSPSATLDVVGTVSAAVKNFRIDHPLDPSNKTLTHACIESSEMMNLYRGNAVLDGFGEALVTMPTWFEALNEDFSYQLTAIGAPAPGLYVARELSDGHFSIAGGSPGMKVSWLLSGVRHDAYALAHPLTVEQEKGTARGTLLYPKELEEAFVAAPR